MSLPVPGDCQLTLPTENEKLPFELGWSRRADDNQITAAGIYLMIANVAVHFLGAQLGLGE